MCIKKLIISRREEWRMKAHIPFLAVAISFSCLVSASSAKASVITLTCTGIGCPNPVNGGTFQGFSIVQFPVVLSTVLITPIDFIQTFGLGGIFAFNGEEGQFGGGTLTCDKDCAALTNLSTGGLQVFHDPFVGLTITFDSSELAPVPEPPNLLLIGSGLLGIAVCFRYRVPLSDRFPFPPSPYA
jgi:hypothetical protein